MSVLRHCPVWLILLLLTLPLFLLVLTRASGLLVWRLRFLLCGVVLRLLAVRARMEAWCVLW